VIWYPFPNNIMADSSITAVLNDLQHLHGLAIRFGSWEYAFDGPHPPERERIETLGFIDTLESINHVTFLVPTRNLRRIRWPWPVTSRN
jgi:hypothetical protein